MIIEEKDLNLKNVLIIKQKVNKKDVNDAMQDIQTFLTKNNIEPSNVPISYTNKINIENNQDTIPIQMLIPLRNPIKKDFDFPKGFKFKKNITIKNIVSAHHSGAANELNQTQNELINFLRKNNFTRSTPFHYVPTEENKNIQKIEMDIFVGIE